MSLAGVPSFWPGGVRHGDDVSLICGFRGEQGKACLDMSCTCAGERECLKWRPRERSSTDAGRAGGPVRSSDEGPVMGLERRGRVVRGWSVRSTGCCPGGVAWTS